MKWLSQGKQKLIEKLFNPLSTGTLLGCQQNQCFEKYILTSMLHTYSPKDYFKYC